MAAVRRPSPRTNREGHQGRTFQSKDRKILDDPVREIIKSGKAIGLSDWEINAMIATCQSQNSFDKCLRILIEYSQLSDNIFVLLKKRNSYFQKVLSVIACHNNKDFVQLPGHVRKLSEYSLKSWISISRWRQLQWTPRPISVTLAGTKSLHVNFHIEFDSQLQLLLNKVKEHQLSLPQSGVDLKDFMIFLLSSSSQCTRGFHFAEVLYPQEDSMHRRNFNEAALLAPYDSLLEIFSKLFAEENSSYNTWRQFSEADVLPVLALTYGGLVTLISRSDGDLYSQATQTLVSYYYRNFTHEHRQNDSERSSHDQVLSLMSSLNRIIRPAQTLSVTDNSSQTLVDDTSSFLSSQFHGSTDSLDDSIESQRRCRSCDSLDAQASPLQLKDVFPSNLFSNKSKSTTRRLFATPRQIMSTKSDKRPLSSGGFLGSQSTLPHVVDHPISKSETSTPRILMKSSSQTSRVVDVTVPLTKEDKLCLRISRTRLSDGQDHFIIAEFLKGCPEILKSDCEVGDELININGIGVRGKSYPDVITMLKFAGGLCDSSRSVHGVGPRVNLRLRRSSSKDGWICQSITQISSDNSAIINDIEEEFARMEKTIETSAIESFRQLRENLLRKFRAKEWDLDSLDSQKEMMATTLPTNPLPSEVEALSTPPMSPKLRDGSTELLKSIFTNHLKREDTRERLPLTSPKQVSKRKPPTPANLSSPQASPAPKFLRDSKKSSTTSSIQAPITPSPQKFESKSLPSVRRLPASSGKAATARTSRTSSEVFLSKYSLVILREALKAVHTRFYDPKRNAAARIQVWWRLVYPQKKLYHAMWVKELCQSFVYQMFDWAYEKTIQVRRIRRQIMREGAAIKIQRGFRHWRQTILMNCIRIQRFARRCLARKGISRLVLQVRAAIRIARFLCARRKRLRQPVGKKQIYRRVLLGLFETIGIRLREKKLKDLTQSRARRLDQQNGHAGRSAMRLQVSQRDIELFKQRNRAVIRIQAMIRRWAAIRLTDLLRKEKHQYQQMCITRVLGRMLRMIKRHQIKRRAIIKIAAAWRGCCSRWKLMIKVLASYKIRACWRSYKEYWKLKKCLRRGDIPITIVLHRLTDIPPSVLTTGTLKVRVSVWWSSLLHLVEKKADFHTIIQSKNPNIVRTSSLFVATNEGVESSSKPPVVHEQTKPQRVQRKLSLSEQTRLLIPHESCRKLTESDKLAEFARQHTKSLNSPYRPPASFCIPHRESVGGSSPQRNAIAEESDHSSSSSSSDSSDDESDSDSEDEDESKAKEEPLARKILEEKVVPTPKLPRLTTDTIGRDCTNLIGSNLIPDRMVEAESNLTVARKLFQTSLSVELSQSASSRILLRPVSRSERDPKPAAPPFSPFPSISENIISALKPSALLSQGDRSVGNLTVNMNDETLYIPGCHGNSVIRFEFFDGDIRKVGSYIYGLADEKRLMFWGGESMHDVPLTPFGRTRMSLNSTHNGVFSVEISSGRPRCSKCGWAMVCVKGSGPLMRKTRAKRFFKAYFDSWESLYLSLDGEWLYLFSARNSPEPSYSISISQLKRIHVEIAPDNSQHTRSNSENSKSITLEDRFLVILSTISNDLIQLRFQDRTARENWVRTIVHAVQCLEQGS